MGSVVLKRKHGLPGQVVCGIAQVSHYEALGWSVDDLATAKNRIASLEQQLKDAQKKLETVEPNWQGRRTDTSEGWLNELNTLIHHPRSSMVPGWYKDSMRVIHRNLKERLQK
jgi:hypothetical protein